MAENTDNKEKQPQLMSRRSFLQKSALMGAAFLAASSVIPQETEAKGRRRANKSGHMNISGRRTLGSGSAALTVSALGLGCMGMNYNRSVSPSRKECIKVIREAVERGVTLFDTAIIYGPLINEELVGEALAPYNGQVGCRNYKIRARSY